MSDYLFKIPFVGDGGVGKTSFVTQYVQKRFMADYKMTIGVDFRVKLEVLPDGSNVKVQLWDTGGQERFTSIRQMYYRGAAGFAFMYDITNRSSFQNLDRWFEEIYKYNPNVKIIIIGNKIDLTHNRVISSGQGQNYALSKGVLFAESSAKTGEGVQEAMLTLLKAIVSDYSIRKKWKVSSKTKRTVSPNLLTNDEILLYEYK